MKKFFLSLSAFTLAALPLVSGVRADNGSFEPIIADAAWAYADYRVERLVFASDSVGPISVGPAVLVAEATDTPWNTHVSMLKNGMKMTWTNVPLETLESQRFARNGNRLVYVQAANLERSTYALTERNLQDGHATTLVNEAFFQNPASVNAMVDGSSFVFNPVYKPVGTAFRQAGTEVWSATEQKAKVIHPHWYSKTLRREELMDVSGDLALVKVIFEGGEKELWFMNAKDTDGNMSNKSIPGTWTEAHGDIVAAHFRTDGSIEFFQNFVRYTYNPKTNERAVRHEGEFLNWYRSIADAHQLSGNRMAWVNPEDRLFVSDLDGVTEIGTATNGRFLLDADRLFYATGGVGAVYHFKTKETSTLPFAVTDTLGDIIVGVDVMNNVQYQNMKTGRGFTLGHGSTPVISDEAHVYWRGSDGIYEATINPAKKLSVNPVRALRVSGESQIWLVSGEAGSGSAGKDGARRLIRNPEVYFSWFGSWASVEDISASTLMAYPDEGTALFAPGTKVKATDNRDLYMVGRDNKLHWIPSEPAAWRIFGEAWNKQVVEVAPGVLFDYMTGDPVSTEQEAQSI